MMARFSGLFVFAFVFTFIVTANADDAATDDMIAAESKISTATVYADRAKVTRVAEVDIPAGAHTVVFKNMPIGILTDSLRAEGSSKAAVKFGAVSHKQIMSVGLSSEREQELRDQIEALNDQLSVINAERAGIDAQKTFIGNVGQLATLRNNENLAEFNLKPEQWMAAAQTIFTGTVGSAR